MALLSVHDGRLDTGMSLGTMEGWKAALVNKANQTWTTSDTVHLESLQGAMPPNTRGSTRPSHSHSQNLVKPPVQQSHRPRAVTAHDNDHDNLSGAQSAADEEPMELFLDLMLGTPILFYVEKDVSNREQIAKLIRVCFPCVNRSPSAVSLTTIRSMVAPCLRRTRPSTIFSVRFARNASAVARPSVWQDRREQMGVCEH